MAASRDSVPSQYENGGLIETVGPKYAEIVVIRHGETKWNADRRIQGQLDVDLSDIGRKQAFAVADRLSREPKISAVYSSDLKRALDTAEIIAKSCGCLRKYLAHFDRRNICVFGKVIKDLDLRERHCGALQGVLFREAAKINPEAYKALLSDQDDLEIPGGGESFNQLYNRCTSALQSIAKKHRGDRVVVVSHGAAIEALHKRASPSGNCKGKVLNASVNVFHLSNEDEWIIKSWGDVRHLNQTGFLESGFGGDRKSG
ncbi:UNVERIFIED_CONTAM: Phosphoglycerate mutase-like protein 4 [Sesamum calycinum]|uniref:Phosphoglycerate mutase-like protein 4 n=1 Tax=Sesamum calycinum TaxID=2727403 RepID=A0AAW2LUU5_9LAMI